MGFFKFIFSKTFLIQLIIAAILVVVIAFLALRWLDYSTNQDQRIAVPDLSKQSLDEVDDKLATLDLRFEILDSANFNPDFPRYSVIEQVPEAGQFVKENRKIYLTLNPSGYRKVMIPDLIRKTRRQAEPTLRSLGFEIGDVSYKPDIAEDAVLELRHKGKKLEPGDEIMKTSTIDLVLGDGSGRYEMDEEGQDTTIPAEEEIEF
ncbi:PASTA domain-containing protein [Salegentibacter holothuriorum]|uniref:PASTA domain-containing protein n=1 Tax=Salegentibacter holothuriorum TaxID=241145 RepID=A0A1T5D635_9FLAO|nr:PASTA domain-containing protein [Salegentibacter holothuriorum]SKB67067.1 PASTA domain-containing protein [Salegentibacter holothuriorum]